jgi:hypothetical protein
MKASWEKARSGRRTCGYTALEGWRSSPTWEASSKEEGGLFTFSQSSSIIDTYMTERPKRQNRRFKTRNSTCRITYETVYPAPFDGDSC